jgi:PKD repeat protein
MPRAQLGRGEVHVANLPARLVLGAILATILAAAGCSSCQQPAELPAPVPQEGRLPRAPEPVTTPSVGYIPPPSCVVVASSSVEEGVAPLEVKFSAEGMCTDADGIFTWDFGDGSPSVHDPNPTYVYTKPGTYTARVTLADPEHNAADTDETDVTVTAE